MSDTPEVQLQLKKRARRRLVGAVAVAGLAAVVLPMVMDEEPKQQVQDVQIRIPGLNQTPLGLAPAKGGAASAAVAADLPAEKPVEKTAEKAADKAAESPAAKAAEKPVVKAAGEPAERKSEVRSEHKPEKPAEKSNEKANDKPAEKAGDKPKALEKPAEKAAEKPARANENGQYLILIGAFANPANVKQLQTKIGELGIKVITEPLDSPDGKRTRVRAGPFASREAADKALEKIKRIGVNGVVAAKQ